MKIAIWYEIEILVLWINDCISLVILNTVPTWPPLYILKMELEIRAINVAWDEVYEKRQPWFLLYFVLPTKKSQILGTWTFKKFPSLVIFSQDKILNANIKLWSQIGEKAD